LIQKVLVVGQIPPPFHGQAISIQLMLEGNYRKLRLHHVRMAFSHNISEVGKFKFKKLFHLFTVISSIIYTRFRHRTTTMYYVPAGPDKIPMYRDLVILLSTRWLFKKTVFQFRAAGISEIYPKLSSLTRYFFEKAYFKTDLAISLSEFNPPDGKVLQAKKNIVVYNGLEDVYPRFSFKKKSDHTEPRLLYVGAIRKSKGIMVLVETCDLLKKRGFKFKLKIMGKFKSECFKKKIENYIHDKQLENYIVFIGELTGDMKWNEYYETDIFVFPSFFKSEATSRVVIEAMSFEIPVVATKWRGIQAQIEEGKSGLLVPIKDSGMLADKISILLNNPQLRQCMGSRGREIFLEKFTIARFWQNMEKAFLF